GIGTQVVDERGAGADLFFLDAQLFDDDLLDALFDAAHWSMAPVEAVAVGSVRDSCGGGTGRLAPFSFNDLAAVADQGMYMPPFTCRGSPLMWPASGPARKATARAMSAGSPRRPSAICWSMVALASSGRSRVMSVAMKPGATTFTVTPRLPISFASDFEN